MNSIYLSFFGGGFGTGELIVIGIFAILIFGNRLPSVAKNLGRSVVQFKKGLKSIEDEIDVNSSLPPAPEKTSPEETKTQDKPAT